MVQAGFSTVQAGFLYNKTLAVFEFENSSLVSRSFLEWHSLVALF